MLGKTTKQPMPEQRPAPEPRPADLSVIKREMRITGDCESSGHVRIEGRVCGNVTAKGVEILESGFVEGDIVVQATDGDERGFVIDGHVAGTVHATKVRVGPNGSVEGGIRADEAVVHGSVRGGVIARRRLALDETAKVDGDVYARRLALKEGAMVNGTMRMGDHVTFDDADEGDGGGKPEASDAVREPAEVPESLGTAAQAH